MKKFLELFNGGYGMVGAKKLLLPSDHPAIADHLKHLGEPNCSADEVVEDIIASPSSGPSGPGNSDSGAADPGEPGEQAQSQQDKGQAQAQGKANANGKVKARAKADAKVSAKAKSKHKPEAMKWPSQHLDYAIKQDIDWGSQRIVATDKLKEKFPGLKGWTDREMDILATKRGPDFRAECAAHRHITQHRA